MYLHITDMTTEPQRHYPEGKILKEIFVCPLCLGKNKSINIDAILQIGNEKIYKNNKTYLL